MVYKILPVSLLLFAPPSRWVSPHLETGGETDPEGAVVPCPRSHCRSVAESGPLNGTNWTIHALSELRYLGLPSLRDPP